MVTIAICALAFWSTCSQILRISSEEEASNTPAKSLTYPLGLSCAMGSAHSGAARQTTARIHVSACHILRVPILIHYRRRQRLQIGNKRLLPLIALNGCNMRLIFRTDLLDVIHSARYVAQNSRVDSD